ncbi:MAG: hypothetical protein PHQ86_09825 [Dehalococcoidales bacterium]|nr:hypothetical protein [Dehalococcoidales bacterium]
MVKLTQQELHSITILRTNPDFKVFLDVLNRSAIIAAAQSATIKDEVIMRWNQGRYQELDEILKVVKTSDEELRAFKSSAHPGK